MNSDQIQAQHDVGRTESPRLHPRRRWETCWECVDQHGLKELIELVTEEQRRGAGRDA